MLSKLHLKRRCLPKCIRYASVCLIVYTFVLLIQYESLVTKGSRNGIRTQSSRNGSSLCPDVLGEMTKGRWIQWKVTESQQRYMKRFVSDARGQYFLPNNMQRTDGRCGNTSFQSTLKVNRSILRYFRAMCDPDGRSPCCRLGTCQSLPVEKCTCRSCFDLRREIHAELATWTVDDARCRMREFTDVAAVCRLLIGSNLVVAGDSLMRQLYVALVLIVSGNLQNGALQQNITKDVRELCSGMHQFTSKQCRKYLIYNAVLCRGTVTLSFVARPRAASVKNMLADIKSLAHIGRSLLLVGLGQYDSFDARLVTSGFLLPILTYRKSSRLNWPRLVWTSVHSYSALAYTDQRNVDSIDNYNKDIVKLLTHWNVPVLDTFNMTRDIISIDGVHYGQGVNFAKARVLLSYISEQKRLQQW